MVQNRKISLLINFKKIKVMETIVNFLHEWAIPGLLLCILILVIIGIRQHRVNNSANEEDNESSGEGELPLAEESPAEIGRASCRERV